MRKWHLTLKWCPEAPVFAYIYFGSCTLKNETVLCEAIGYAIFEVGSLKKEERRWRNRRFSRFLVMTSAV